MRVWTKEQIETANLVYHRYEAELYDEGHPEIFASEERRWADFFDGWDKARPAPAVILDIGAGTGFIYGSMEKHLREGDRFIASDLSPEMLELCRKRAQKSGFLQILVSPADKLALQDNSVDLITVNSVLHHLPDPSAFLREASRLLKPGGILAIMHEPNLAFAKSWFMRNVARLASRLAMRTDRSIGGQSKKDYSHIYHAVNQELLERRLIGQPLDARQIQSMVDIHSPTAGGSYEEIGFSLDFFQDHGLRNWQVESFKTYNFLGKLDPTVRLWRRGLNGILKMVFPNCGSSFSLVTRKSV
ncbi:MAG: class I SAM-dependent methyltransferase [Patescibacteria group bacterium]|jgi:ubiquinone/menaquinone biosynthesis C-methylase UbiE